MRTSGGLYVALRVAWSAQASLSVRPVTAGAVLWLWSECCCLVAARPNSSGIPRSAMQGDGTSSVIQIETLTRERVPELAELMHDGFGGKACCLCLTSSASMTASSLADGYAKYPDEKLAVCGLALEYPAAQESGGRGGGAIVGFCQLTLPGLPGDYELPECLSGALQECEGHIDRIAVAGHMRGRGIGKKLLDWADNTCRTWDPAHGGIGRDDDHGTEQLVAPGQRITKISLEVVQGNSAQRLYERHGYVVEPEGCCDRWCNICCVFFLMRKCGAKKMVKTLLSS